jgi:hypothetical protein
MKVWKRRIITGDFDAYNLCQAFYGLNHRLNTLLQSDHLHILYDSPAKFTF